MPFIYYVILGLPCTIVIELIPQWHMTCKGKRKKKRRRSSLSLPKCNMIMSTFLLPHYEEVQIIEPIEIGVYFSGNMLLFAFFRTEMHKVGDTGDISLLFFTWC